MLAALLNIPHDQNTWNIWSLHHRLSHTAIRQKIAANGGPQLTDYQLDPIFDQDIQGFLQRNSQTHIEMDAALGAQSTDLQDVDFKDERQRIAWISEHYLEHYNAENALGIGS